MARKHYRRLWRRLRWHRRKFAALLAAVAAFTALDLLRPPPPPTVLLVIARHDVAAGAKLRAGDVLAVRYPRAFAPDHAVTRSSDAIGRFAAAGLARGLPLTALSISGAAWSNLGPGRAAVPLRLQDSAVADLLRPGQRVRLAAVDPRTPREADVLVEDAVVLSVPTPDRGPTTSTTTGRLVVFDVPETRTNLVTSSAVSRYLTVIWGH